MLRGANTAHELVELLAAVAAGDDHRTVEVTTQGFEDFLTEATEIVDSRGRWGVVDASG